MNIRIIFFFFCCLILSDVSAQMAADTSTPVEILPGARKFEYRKLPDGSELQILAGNVRLRQGTSLFYCDSCVINTATRQFQAFGNVHINDSDTAHVYSNYLRYLIDPRFAYLTGNVRLTDGHGTLYTNELEYDMMSKIGTYKNGGRVVNDKSVLTSREGIYYADVRDVFFKNNVELKDPAYYLKTDSMIYNTESATARLISQTYIRDSSGRVIRTKEGYYDMRNRMAQFTQRTTVEDGSLRVSGDEILNDDASGMIQIRGRGVLIDTAQGVNIIADEIFADKRRAAYLATRKPLMIIKQENDSIYIAADTLFSARLSDLPPRPVDTSSTTPSVPDSSLLGADSSRISGKTTASRSDTLKQVTPTTQRPGTRTTPLPNDSTNRYFEAYRNVRIFTDSVQAVSDSLFYSFKDSVFQLFQNPVVWSNKSQITGDTIHLYTRNKKAEKVHVFENSFIVNELEPLVYNQIRSIRINGYFVNGVIDSVRARGSAESIYFIRDEDSAYTGINQTSSDVMDVYFANGDLRKIVFRSAVKGTMYPASRKRPGEMRLTGFSWLEELRPKTKYDLYE